MIREGVYRVLEFNARFGDPEAQVLLTRMKGDLYSWCEAAANGDLSDFPAEVPATDRAAMIVIGAAPGYPDQVEKGIPLHQLELSFATEGSGAYFCAGVQGTVHAWVSSGGRVFGAMGTGESLMIARKQAYSRLNDAAFKGMQYRDDIGGRLS